MPDRRCMQGARARQMRGRWAAVAVTMLSGCIVGPNSQRPALPAPAVFRGAAEDTVPPAPTSLGDLQWFEIFKDAQLHALIRTALVANDDLRESMARVDEARAALGITRSEQSRHAWWARHGPPDPRRGRMRETRSASKVWIYVCREERSVEPCVVLSCMPLLSRISS